MFWRESCAMDERMMFIGDYTSAGLSMAELCERYEVSRKTGYKWLSHYRVAGAAGLMERSHAPHVPGRTTAPALAEAIVGLRQEHPSWGPRKIVARLAPDEPSVLWPAASTAGEILKRAGLV